MPIAIAVTVSSIVLTSPCRIRGEVNQWPTSPHSNRELAAIELASSIARKTMTPTASHRPGCRSGTALICSGATSGVSGS